MLPARAVGRLLRPHRNFARRLASENKAPRIDISQRCADRINALTKSKGEPVALRITVDGGGCSGFQYLFALETETAADAASTKDEDNCFSHEGAKVIVDDISLAYMEGAKIDYVEEMISSSFQVTENPNSESNCGCGVSFSAKT